MTDETRVLDDLQHLFVIPLYKGKLKPILCGVDVEDLGFRSSIQTVYTSRLDSNKVNRLVESPDDPVVSDAILALAFAE